MDPEENAMNRLLKIEANLKSSHCLDDIFEISFIYSTLERFSEVFNMRVISQCLNLIRDAITTMRNSTNDVFESQMPLIIRSVVQCLDIDDVRSFAETILYDMCQEQKYVKMVQNQIQKNKSEFCTSPQVTILERILNTLDCPRSNRIKPEIPSLRNFEADKIPEISSKNRKVGSESQDGTIVSGHDGHSSKTLSIEFLPQSMTEEWLLARSSADVANILEEVYLVYQSISYDKRLRYSADVSKVVRQTIKSMQSDDLPVLINGLQLLEVVAEDHANDFISDLGILFPVIQRCMDDPRIAIRHHGLRLGGTIAIRIPFSTIGRYVFAAIEYKPQHPEISLKCAALSLLSVRPQQAGAFTALISRMIIIADDYIDTENDKPDKLSSITPRSQAALDAAKDLIAVAIMLICCSSDTDNSESIESKLPKRLCSVLGINATSHTCTDICNRAMQSSFPSLETDAKLSALAALAMEISLRQDSAPMSARRNTTLARALSGPADQQSRPHTPPISQESCMSAVASSTSLHPKPTHSPPAQSPAKQNEHPPKRPSITIQIPSSPASGINRLKQSEQETPVMDYPMGEGSYMPSWTPTTAGSGTEEGYQSLASPWAIRQETPTGEMDRTKLRSIKRGGRKPGSRLRARTADETSHSEEWGKDSDSNTPSTAGGRLMGGVDSSDVNDTGPKESNMEFGPGTPIELGIYNTDGKREHKLESNKTKAPLPPKYVSHAARRRAKTEGGEDLYVTPERRGFKGMDSLQYSYDENDEDNDIMISGGMSNTSSSVKFDVGRKAGSVDTYENTKNVKVYSARPQPSTTFHVKGNSVFGGNTESTEDLMPPPAATMSRPRRQPSNTSLAQAEHQNSGSSKDLNDFHERSTHESTATPAQDAFEYLATEDLEPCTKPSKEISNVVSGLMKSDWPEIFHTLNTVRRLAVHHKAEVVRSGQLHQIVVGVTKQVENLRSAAAKNAILALGDFFYGVQTGMDSEVPASSAVLVKRIADSSVFISETVDSTLQRMITYSSPSKSLAALLNGVDNRSPSIRGQVVRVILMLYTERYSELNNPKDTEAMLQKFRKILADTSPESRTFGREIVRLMINKRIVSRETMEQTITVDGLDKAMKQSGTNYLQNRYISTTKSPANRSASPSSSRYSSPKPKRSVPTFEFPAPSSNEGSDSRSGKIQSTEDLMVSGISPRGTGEGIAMKPRGTNSSRMSKHEQEQHPALLALPGLLMVLSSKNWQERRDALTTLSDSMVQNEALFTAANKMEKCMDAILEKFDDGSVKVSTHAVSCARRLQNGFPQLLPGMLTTSLPSVLGAASSANKQVNSEGSRLLHAFLASSSNDSMLAQQLVGIALHDKERLRAASFRAMSIFVNIRCSDRQNSENIEDVMRRIFFPAICQTLCAANSKPEVKTTAADTLRAIQNKCDVNIET